MVDETGIADITDFYQYVDWEGNQTTWEVTAKVDLILYEETRNADNRMTIPAGTVMRMTGLCHDQNGITLWTAFEVDAVGQTLWLPVEKADWRTLVHTGNDLIDSEEAFDGFYYAG